MYIESFKGNIKNSDYQGQQAEMNYDFHFYGQSLISLKILKKNEVISEEQYKKLKNWSK